MSKHAEPAMRIRPGDAGDLPALARIETAAASLFPTGLLQPAFLQPVPLSAMLTGIAADLLWVAEDPAVGAIGFLLAQAHGDCLHIAEMDVTPRHGRRGVGTALLLHARQVAQARGFARLSLTTFEHLPWNAPFYSRHGFVRVERPEACPHLQQMLQRAREAGVEHRIAMVTTPAGPGSR